MKQLTKEQLTLEQLVKQHLMEQLTKEQLKVVEQLAAGHAPTIHAVGTITDGRVKPTHGVWEDHGVASLASKHAYAIDLPL